MTNYLDFEKPLAEIEGKAAELRAMARMNEDRMLRPRRRRLIRRRLICWSASTKT